MNPALSDIPIWMTYIPSRGYGSNVAKCWKLHNTEGHAKNAVILWVCYGGSAASGEAVIYRHESGEWVEHIRVPKDAVVPHDGKRYDFTEYTK